MSEVTSRPKMEWKARGPVFNSWWLEFQELMDALNKAQPHPWWVMDTDLKYLNIRIDTRDNGFILTDSEGTQIEPSRVLKAISAFYERFPSTTPSYVHESAIEAERERCCLLASTWQPNGANIAEEIRTTAAIRKGEA